MLSEKKKETVLLLDDYERLALLRDWELQQSRISELVDKLVDLFGLAPECVLFDTLWGTFNNYTELLAKILGDDSEWLDWYQYENGMGKKRGKVEWEEDGKKKSVDVDSVRVLLALINKDEWN